MSAYLGLSRAALSFEYLHTNSTTHEFLFGALAELIDNSKDARSKKIEIYSEGNEDLRGGYMLCFLDDGCGMGREEAHHVITFGRSAKKAMDTSVIGQYGNGLKSGSMRVAKDFIVFSKTKDLCTCIYMSRTFHEDEKIDEVIVPIPSWDVKNRKPYPSTPEDLQKHVLETDIIYRHSPFKTEADIFGQFDKIESDTGTLVVLIHMKLLDNGEPELDVKSDPTDIIMGSEKGLTHEGLVLERRSLRAYTSIMYLEPVMKIYIQGIKVQTRRLANCLYKPKQFKFSSTRFKTRAENDAREARTHAKLAEEKAREAESKYRDLLKRVGNSVNREARSKLNLAKNDAEDYRSEAIYKTKLADQKEKLLKDPKILHLIFGFNIENRSCDGMFMYNCGRLIKMYDRTGPQLDGKVTCNGIVGIVDVPYIVLQPAHNKQDFADGKEYRHLLKVMGEHLLDYWNDSGIVKTGVTEFWESFGYDSSKKWWEPPSDELRYVKKRQMNIPQAIQCDMCLKWRLLPTSSSNIGKQYPPNWVCNNNPDAQYNRCNAPEQKFSFPLIDRKKLNKDAAAAPPPEDKPPIAKAVEMPSFGRTILRKPDVLPPMRIFKPSPLPMSIIGPTKVNESPRLLNQTPLLTKRSIVPDESSPSASSSSTPKIPSKSRKTKSPSPEPPPRSKSSSRIQAVAAAGTKEKERALPLRKKSPSPPPKPKARQSRRSPSPEAPKRSRRKSPSPEVDKRKSAALNAAALATNSSTGKSRKKSPSPEVTPQNKASPKIAAPTREKEKEEKSMPSRRTERQENISQKETSNQQAEPKSSRLASSSNSTPPQSFKKSESKKSSSKEKESEEVSTADESIDDPAPLNVYIGAEMQVLHSNKWLDVKVLEIHSRTKKVKVQFKQKNNPDKWVSQSELRSKSKSDSSSSVSSSLADTTPKIPITNGKVAAPSAIKISESSEKSDRNVQPPKKPSNSLSMPSDFSATDKVSTSESEQKNNDLMKIVDNFRSMLRYFNPPGWTETESADSLTLSQLASFPLASFYKTYEQGLRKLMARQVQKQQEQVEKQQQQKMLDQQKLLENEVLEFKQATISVVNRLCPQGAPSNTADLEAWTSFLRGVYNAFSREEIEDDKSAVTSSINGTSESSDQTNTNGTSSFNANGVQTSAPETALVNGGSDDSAFEEPEMT